MAAPGSNCNRTDPRVDDLMENQTEDGTARRLASIHGWLASVYWAPAAAPRRPY